MIICESPFLRRGTDTTRGRAKQIPEWVLGGSRGIRGNREECGRSRLTDDVRFRTPLSGCRHRNRASQWVSGAHLGGSVKRMISDPKRRLEITQDAKRSALRPVRGDSRRDSQPRATQELIETREWASG